jgi:hypothetical protein
MTRAIQRRLPAYQRKKLEEAFAVVALERAKQGPPQAA